MRFKGRFVLMTLTVGLALNWFATAGHAQGLSDFGLVGRSPIWDKIRQMTEAEVKRIENTRVCNLSVPLAGSANEAADASESDWKETLAAYELWESDYQRRLIFREPLIGLAWTVVADPIVGRQLAIFLGIWLIGAAELSRSFKTSLKI
jgi:hypothetical protein